ncbi:MAG: glycosyltransferase family 39 protein [Ferruginibacter sp.]
MAIFFLRLLFISLMGLMPQDAYYYFYSQHPALSYFDHPPALAYIIRIFTEIFGKHVFVIKLADTFISLLSVVAFYFLSRRFLSGQRAGNAVIIFFSTLMLTILSLVSTPDVPLILFSCLSLLSLHDAIFRNRHYHWILAGIWMGLAFDSKYTAIFLPAGLILFLIVSDKYRRLFFSPGPWISILFLFITALPVIIWNIENNFASFKFQSSERAGSVHINPVGFFGVLGHQAAILMPILFFFLIFILYKTFNKHIVKRLRITPEKLFLFCFFLPVFLGFLAVSWIYWVKLNWMMPAYITGIILISIYATQRLIRLQVIFSLAVHLMLAAEVVLYPVPIRSDDTWIGWDDLAKQVDTLKSKHPERFIFAADDYKTSAVLNFYLPEFVYGRNVIGEPALQFDYIGTDLALLKGRDAFFINSVPRFSNEGKENQFPPSLQEHFESVIETDPIIIMKNGKAIRKFLVFECRNYRGPAGGR